MTSRLYHGSSRALEIIEPRAPLGSTISEKFVFAHVNEIVAHAYALRNQYAFTVGIDDGWIYTAIMGEKNWRDSLTRSGTDQGGYIHEFPADHFRPLANGEWISKRQVMPEKTRFVTIKDCMHAGVQILIVHNIIDFAQTSPVWTNEPSAAIMRGIYTGGLRWLNRESNAGPILPPAKRKRSARPLLAAIPA